MTVVPLALGYGTLTFLAFAALALFVVLGSMSLLRHTRRVQAPYEADLTEAGRRAQEFEHPSM